MSARLQTVQAGAQALADRDEQPVSAREFAYGWIDAHAALRHLGLGSLSALYDHIKQNQLPFGRVGRHYRFRRADLDQWAARRAVRG